VLAQGNSSSKSKVLVSLMLFRHAIAQAILRGKFEIASLRISYLQMIVVWFGFLGIPVLRALFLVWVQLFNDSQYVFFGYFVFKFHLICHSK
jgi:hypothetical protein